MALCCKDLVPSASKWNSIKGVVCTLTLAHVVNETVNQLMLMAIV